MSKSVGAAFKVRNVSNALHQYICKSGEVSLIGQKDVHVELVTEVQMQEDCSKNVVRKNPGFNLQLHHFTYSSLRSHRPSKITQADGFKEEVESPVVRIGCNN